jgi:UDPglucose 6-dehydrogenase
VRAYDSVEGVQVLKEMPELELCAGPYECAAGADALVIVAE